MIGTDRAGTPTASRMILHDVVAIGQFRNATTRAACDSTTDSALDN